MIPADTHRTVTVWPLADLFDALRREGFQLRPDDYVEVVQVLEAFKPESTDDLQALLAPLLVTSEEEQVKFDRIFEAIRRKNELEPVVRKSIVRRSLPWGWLLIGLLGLLAAGYVAFFWPGPAINPQPQLLSGASLPFEAGDTIRFAVDSSLRQAAGPMVRWEWDVPDGSGLHRNEPAIQVIAKRPGPLNVTLRSQRRRGLLFPTWTDSLRGYELPICAKLPVIRLDSVRLPSAAGRIRYRFRVARIESSAPVQRTQWLLNGGVVASNSAEWEHAFRSGSTPGYYEVRFEASTDTAQRLCFGEARLTVGVPGTNVPPFTIDVRPSGKLITPRRQLDGRYYWALWLVGGLLALAAGYYGWLVIREVLTKRQKPPRTAEPGKRLTDFVSDEPPLEIPLENRQAELITRDKAFYQVVRTLRQPTEGEARRLHVAQTMQATMREGGFPTLVFQPRLAETEYLFLIDRSQVRSQQVALFEYLFQAFMQENVCVERFFFHRTFDLFTNEKQTKGLTLRQLADIYRRHTLVIWSNGYPLLYPPYPVVEPAIRDALADWESRAILTPVPFADWGAKERALQNDFLLLPADLVGQLHLMQALAEKQLRQDTYLQQQIEARYSADYVDFRDVNELREYAGEELFQWLAALAIYPRVRWEVVLEMGRALVPAQAVNFTNLLKLARISWMHDGSFPDLTRFALLKALTPTNEAKARQTLLGMLQYAERYFPGEHFFDGEKYLLQTSNQFSLYAYDAETFADYKPAHEAFGKLYKQGLYPDGAMLRYLENPDGKWTTLLPVKQASAAAKTSQSAPDQPRSIPLRDYLDKVDDEVIDEPPPPPVRKDLRRPLALGAVMALLVIFAGLYLLSGRPGNQVIDWDQQIPVTIVLDRNDCVTALNTSSTDSPRWTVFLDDSLFSINNLTATRSVPLRNSIVLGNDLSGDSATLRTVLVVRDTTAGGDQQSRTVAFSRDTLHVRITCPIPVASRPIIPTAPLVYVQYVRPDQLNEARQVQTRLTASGFRVPGIERKPAFRDSTQVRYVDDQIRPRADSVANLVKSQLTLPTVPVVKVKGSPGAPVEVWLNTNRNKARTNADAAPQRFTCQAVSRRWANQFAGWQASANGYTYTIGGNENSMYIQAESPEPPPTVDPKTGAQYRLGTALSTEFSGSIASICQTNGLYLVETASRSYVAVSLIVRNVTSNSCNIAVVRLDTRLLGGSQGQAYFNKLVQSASFRRYTVPQTQGGKASSGGYRQTSKWANGYDSTAGQANQAVQVPAQTSTEILRVQSQAIPDRYVDAGIQAYQRGQFEQAITGYNKSLQANQILARNPTGTAYVWVLKGYSLFKLKRYDEAVSALLSATKADPKYALAYFDLARVYCAMGQTAEAAAARRQAIELQPDMRTIMQNDKEFISLCGSEASAK